VTARAFEMLAIHALAVCMIDSRFALWPADHQCVPDLFPIQLFAAWHSRKSSRLGIVRIGCRSFTGRQSGSMLKPPVIVFCLRSLSFLVLN
jgi:hypothetical protein